jgi:putative ABC transport system ATP-binding protein
VSPGVRVELEDVSKRYETPAGVVTAVDGINLDVQPGASLAITGPSGSGKSTVLGLIAGLDVPTTGRVLIGGQEISTFPDQRRARARRHGIGLVFQSDGLLPFLTATENVSLRRSLDDPDDGNARTIELLSGLGLDEEADKFPDQLSGGQRQRVAVARALIHRPSLIVADEPTGSLDDENAAAVVDLLIAAQRSSGATLVLVTHEPGVARRLDRTVGMRDGRLTDRAHGDHAAEHGPRIPGHPRA